MSVLDKMVTCHLDKQLVWDIIHTCRECVGEMALCFVFYLNLSCPAAEGLDRFYCCNRGVMSLRTNKVSICIDYICIHLLLDWTK